MVKMIPRLSTGCEALDELMNGGIEVGVITEIFGEGGSGKTNFCLQLARNMARTGKRAIFIDTEGISHERLKQLCGDDYDAISKNIILFHPYTMPEQEEAVDKCLRLVEGDTEAKFGLIILDSATSLYRTTLGTDDQADGRNSLAYQINKLLAIARRKELPVVITSQVFNNLAKREGDKCPVEPLGGHVLLHSAKAILRFDKGEVGERVAIIIKHRSLAEGARATFKITNCGIE